MLDKAPLMQARSTSVSSTGYQTFGLSNSPLATLEMEFCQVATVKVRDQVFRAQIERCPDLHFLPRADVPSIFQSVRPCTEDYAIFQSTVLGL